jgi:ubiquinone/menaquinone biosynthesis C-methylase UbiE
MVTIIPQTPIYKFIKECEESDLERTVLDCGAGGHFPPLFAFHELGYKTNGIDLSKEQLQRAHDFSQKRKIDLKIIKGDMRALPFNDATFSFIYSYNTIFHMTKKDMKKAVTEMDRVLKPGGLCYVNFLSMEDDLYKEGKEQAKGEKVQIIEGEKVLHTFIEDDEVINFFPKNHSFLLKEKRIVQRPERWKEYTAVFIEVITKKERAE